MDFDIEKTRSNPNYLRNRMIHASTFKGAFTEAFKNSEQAQIILTGALSFIGMLRDFKGALTHLESLEGLCDYPQDEASLCYFKGLAYDFLGDKEKMEENYDRYLELNEASEPIYIYLPYIRQAKLLHKSCNLFRSQEYFYKMLEYYERRNRQNERSLSLYNLYFDFANTLMFTHDYIGGLEFVKKAHQVWDGKQDEGNKMIEMMLLALTGDEEASKDMLESIDKSNQVYPVAATMLDKLLKKAEPHYFAIEPDESRLDEFWSWFSKNERKLYKMAYSDNFEKLQRELSNKARQIVDYMERELAFTIEIDNGNITIFAITDYVTSLDYTYERLFERKPKELVRWDFYVQDELNTCD
ncbi:MAG: hypothetical protein IJ004_06480 [Clostridia bacterium]|nr:hypothetical protein [Clostridia bacterium]